MTGTFGIRSTSVVLGEPAPVLACAPEYVEDVGRIRDLGFETFYRAPDGVGVTDLAVRAGTAALAKADVPADEVDLVVFAMADVPEYLYWDAAASVQSRLGAVRAEAVLVNQACSSGVAAFDTVAGKFATHSEYRVALLIVANRIPDAYWNRMDSATAVVSDGAAAAVLVRGHHEQRWLATDVLTDGRYSDVLRMEIGGARQPFVAGGPAPTPMGNPADLMKRFLGSNLRSTIKFVRYNRTRNREVLERACKRAGVRPEDIDLVLHMNADARTLKDYRVHCGLTRARTNTDLAREHGHFGAADQLIALGLLRASDGVRTGELVALTSTGNGMHWACTLLRA
ncbi:3-oxoacyl-[acyl-carrier-protein] synthase III C-terminal domain-containing protein [Actinoplanes sp. NBRC 103695]|uniref:3-oxoacyl-ACP synthase III family protein n=1 Tax=Actinoplanes sp. NBRC 103695 TaxID=3032202 RepID=UPI0024A4C788|nr:3-oxoacyl-[acyl-carrier-protein] synthase III C-terminal domain-containing protein [Actinoplanes sp. NBRC 103695]GLZ01174.1 3-oxoacyl-[acyl-carrier-protein] synthase 3 [Actinoplanes sp. NBRC 103695]